MEGFVGRLFREFGVVLSAAVLVSAFVSLTLTPMLNAYLIKPGKQGQSKFYKTTEKFFIQMNESYERALKGFMARKWLSFPLLIACIGVIVLFYNLLQKERRI